MDVTKTAREGFAERFRLALDEAGFGKCQLKELGARFGVTPQAVRKWLAGDAMPTAEHAPLLATRLGVRRSWLLDGELPMRPRLVDMAELGQPYDAEVEQLSISHEEFRLLRLYRSLPHGLRAVLLQLTEGLHSELAPDTREHR